MTVAIEVTLEVAELSSLIDAAGPLLAAMDAAAQAQFVARFRELEAAGTVVDVQMVDGVARAVPTPELRALFSAEGLAA